MKNFEHAAEVLTALMEERDLTAAELSRQTEVNAGYDPEFDDRKTDKHQHKKSYDFGPLFRDEHGRIHPKNSVDAGFHSFVTAASQKFIKADSIILEKLCKLWYDTSTGEIPEDTFEDRRFGSRMRPRK